MSVFSHVKRRVVLAEVAVVGGLQINRTAQVELVNDVRGQEAEHAVDGADDFALRNRRRAEGVHADADRIGITDGVGKLNFAFRGELGGHDVLGDPAAHVSGAAVHLRRVFAGKRAAAVTAHAAVAVHNDLAPGQAGVALRPADDETPGWVDEKLRFLREQPFGQNFFDDVLDAEIFDLGVRDFATVNLVRMLRGNDDVGDGNGFVVAIFHRDLRFGVGSEPCRTFAALSDFRQFTAEAMREHDGRGHQLGRFIAGVAEHEPLVAGTLLGSFLALGFARVHALGDVGRLLRDDRVHEHFVGMEHVVVVHVPDFADGVAGDFGEIEFRARGDFAADDDDVGFGVALAGDTAEFVLREAGIQDGVRNGVANLVRMAFADGLR